MRLRYLLTTLISVGIAGAQSLPNYTCVHTATPPVIDGMDDDEAWERVPISRLIDVSDLTGQIEHSQPTQFCMTWDQHGLYVLVVATDDDVWSVLEDHDAHLWNDEVIELFADPDGDERNYLEIEINPLNTVLDLLKPSTGEAADWDWNAEIETAVHVEGTLNDSGDEDRYWRVEMALPWSVFQPSQLDVIGDRSVPPEPGDKWRLNIYRYERLRTDGQETQIEYSAWSPTGEINFHRPDRFGIVTFAADRTAVPEITWGMVKVAPK
ncbi:MAG: carbohydrate-binding family 9-like protein [Gemmatimonadetes bacterium]|jgi:hypothetical protein|nr:carbohydrate-binding family 9-like protein [Gemmatimonadota bacterium]MBT5058796.1 carbohydrate-binding family 9-like protein [Gemmatimonadota bacterium]MBT5145984.1 carbohydrate-binding family 9-like protein [Gemmatimonadota bacterium]MBT5588171.1 carbohydrate-binding family 9-like protein [Gemmatimonadota bacterium]MBT5961612.1 carbohydrate-binding family 9-like protein [Gemmatimonadota bacterium]